MDKDSKDTVELLCSLASENSLVWQMLAVIVAGEVGRLPDEMHNRMLLEAKGSLLKEYLERIGS